MNLNDFTFGVELEAILPQTIAANPSHATAHQLAAAQLTLAAGRAVHALGYTHATHSTWKLVTDSSVSGRPGRTAGRHGGEFVSPILTGEAGLAETDAICAGLAQIGCDINTTCGLHVHVGLSGGRRIPFEAVQRAMQLYHTYEDVIDSFMAPTRRGQSNRYCRSIKALPVAQIKASTSVAALIQAICSANRIGSYEARFHKVNLVRHGERGTIEFRQHAGTVDARKVRMWIMFCLRVVARAMQDEIATGVPQTNSRARQGTKAWQIGELLLSEQGATVANVRQITGWSRIAIPETARQLGINIYSVRAGREVRYFAVRDYAAPDLSIDGLATLIGMSDAERAYFKARIDHFVGRGA
jgi:hypothetical protein